MKLVKDVMSSPMFCVEPTESALSAFALLKNKQIRHLLVTSNGILVGVLSVNDFPTHIKPQLVVMDIMSTNVLCVSPSLSVQEAMATLQKNKIGSLPVVDNQQRLIGIVTTYDLNHK